MESILKNITEAQRKKVEWNIEKALRLGKIKDKSEMEISVNLYGNVWIGWKAPNKHIFKFTIFKDGVMCCGLLGK